MISRVKLAFFDCYLYREVLLNILSQDLKVKYKRTILGYFWSLLNPVFQLAVLAGVFSHLTRLEMKDYALFLFSGLTAWTFFQNSLTAASTSLIDNENFIKKIYLPKLLFPVSRVCMKGIDFLFSLIALSMIAVFFGFEVKATAIYLPMAILPLFLFTLGLGLMVAVFTIYFRDIVYLLAVFLQLLYFATPILYQPRMVPASYEVLFRFNPVYSQINLFQKLIYLGSFPTHWEWVWAWGIALFFFLGGILILTLFEEDLVFRL